MLLNTYLENDRSRFKSHTIHKNKLLKEQDVNVRIKPGRYQPIQMIKKNITNDKTYLLIQCPMKEIHNITLWYVY